MYFRANLVIFTDEMDFFAFVLSAFIDQLRVNR